METIVLWHGGRDLEYNYTEQQASKKNRWNHGPGLYLTTHYDTARQYAKGGGKVYQVEVEKGNSIKEINIDISLINDFVSRYVIRNKQKILLEDLYYNMKRLNSTPLINAEVVLNLIFNLEAITSTNTPQLAQFFVDNGVDYGLVNRFKGRDETLLVIYNKNKIKKVKTVFAKDLDMKQYELSFQFEQKNHNLLKL